MSNITHLPLPNRLDPKSGSRTLMTAVSGYFYRLYNDPNNGEFKVLLASVGNKDAETGNRLFDRHNAVLMLKKLVKSVDKNETLISDSKDGDVYKTIVRLMRKHGISLKLRREQYKQLSQAAE